MSKSTPGPWTASKTEPPGDWCIHAKGIPWQLAYITGASTQFDWPVEANARLIAAAPDLLAVLNDIAAFLTWNECSQATPQVRMSKADISNALDHAILSARAAISKAVQS